MCRVSLNRRSWLKFFPTKILSNGGYNKFSALSDQPEAFNPGTKELKDIVGVTALISENMKPGNTCFFWKLHLF
jgi:hypothetical protein